ncbi:alpha/beta hydrolase [Lactiplantibacillus sp. WILCCON 0030]|uniref:Alpha/beta hydrolase n=1 Tax=Lactiplantibacillus brownii TaxID=3069269 RepID=A0ABU1AAH7_9LACO|nr:alpha/beta hydrolase [Lactiplantibacillus brownii]MDQ7937916.1 alpha/beta hydrolase [Lactiplantibacillus brownii]
MRRKQLIISLAGLSVVLVIGSGAYWQHRLQPLKTVQVHQTKIPTIFIGGDYAKAFSTDGFVHRLSETHLMTKALVVHVGRQGQVHVTKYAPLRDNPTIQVIYAVNHQPAKQTRQLAKVMHVLKQRYHVTCYNAVGHSSGGNIIFNYLTRTPQHDQPQIHKFVTLGSNYPAVAVALKKLPAKLPILNIGGQLYRTNGDGTVSLKSVLAFSTALKKQHFQPKTQIIHGGPLTAAHSMLHINPQVDRDIVTFLYGH